MLSKSNFTPEHIRRLQSETRRDPSLLERTVFAFGLLEALTLVGLDFLFKGGSSLMLLLGNPMRLSTDIDIVVAPDTDMDKFIKEAAEISPFFGRKEQMRTSKLNIEKRHFVFFFRSPLTLKESHIILDVVFEDNFYSKTVFKEINNSLLVVDSPATHVTTPSADCILGDKLTAFAPHTIGIPFGVNKELEVIKQHYDIAVLINELDSFTDAKDTYKRIAELEIEYRELKNMSYRETLIDTFNTTLAIIGKGKLFPNDYSHLKDGMRRIKGHIFSDYSPVVAETQSCRIAHFIASILGEKELIPAISDVSFYSGVTITSPAYSKLNHVKKASLTDFAYLYEAVKLFEEVS